MRQTVAITIITATVATDTAAAPGDVPTADLDAARAQIVELLNRTREDVLAEWSALLAASGKTGPAALHDRRAINCLGVVANGFDWGRR
jgi:hypothetical protein